MASFETPAILKNRSEEDFYTKIKEILPSDLDLSEGGHGWNLTRPIALVAAEICEFILPEVVKLIIPDTSYGEFLVGHAKGRGIYPKEAVAATGELTISGKSNTVIPAGSLFSVPALNSEPSVDYETTEEAIIGDSGSVTVEIRCTQTGTIGNTGANTIILVSSKLTDITGVNNEQKITGGAEEESDESLIERISEYDKTQGFSFVGNDDDYIRWAKEAGAGNATVVHPEDESGLVTLIVTDENGAPAQDKLIEAVYNHIMRPNDRNARLAPIGAQLNVVPPETYAVLVNAIVELEDNASLESVKTEFATKLAIYMAEALEDREIKISRVGSILSSVTGLSDFKQLGLAIRRDDGTIYSTNENIQLAEYLLPTVDKADLWLEIGSV